MDISMDLGNTDDISNACSFRQYGKLVEYLLPEQIPAPEWHQSVLEVVEHIPPPTCVSSDIHCADGNHDITSSTPGNPLEGWTHSDLLQEVTNHDIHDDTGDNELIELTIDDAQRFITHSATSYQAVALYRSLAFLYPAHERACEWQEIVNTDEQFCATTWTNSDILMQATSHFDSGDSELVIEDALQFCQHAATPSQVVAVYRALAHFYPNHENASHWRYWLDME
jgi:hypothetical protein